MLGRLRPQAAVRNGPAPSSSRKRRPPRAIRAAVPVFANRGATPFGVALPSTLVCGLSPCAWR